MSRDVIKNLDEGKKWVKARQDLFSKPAVILLSGPMGAGKTQIVRWVLEELGSAEASSPTFAIHQRYQTKKMTVDHFDLYRLDGEFELEECGFWEMVDDPDNLVLVEWADRLSLPVKARRRMIKINVVLCSGDRAFEWEIVRA